ncbi:MAG TPA: type II toxin-antitoxin system VapB family antitoxin [Terriglobia bacterium]|nr:type II toxin-antitoxin system VapB family antitoxin [Terriglobia bacterium]
MRTTIRLDDELLLEAKRAAANTGRTLTAVIEDSLRETLARRRQPGRRRRVRLPTFKGTGLRPGIDLDDSAALLDRMEEWDATHRR